MKTELEWEPVNSEDGWGDVLPGFRDQGKPSCRILDMVEHLEVFPGNPRQDAFVIVQVVVVVVEGE